MEATMSSSSVETVETLEPLNEIVDNLSLYFESFNRELEKKLINEKEARNLFSQLQHEVRISLTKVFGDEFDVRDLGDSQGFLKYKNNENIYSDAVLFSYWSHSGTPFDASIDKPGVWRENFFYKGIRWSNKQLKNQFYTFFNIIRDAAEDITPVNFFVRNGINMIQHLKIVNGLTNNQAMEEETIRIPSEHELENLGSEILNKLVQKIKKMRDANQYNNVAFESFKENFTDQLRQVKENFVAAFDEVYKNHRDALSKWLKEFERILGSIDNNRDERQLFKEVFAVVISYQYYDHPYDIHMFLPMLQKDQKHLTSCLIITVPSGNREIDSYKGSLIKLIEILRLFGILEEEIWKRLGSNTPIYWKWKDIYEKRREKYERISQIVTNICQAICQKNKVQSYHIAHRVKNFESLYTKIIDRANDTTDTTKAERYRSAILRGKDQDVEYIFSDLRDVAGVRIICVYENDIQRIKNIFEDLRNKGEIDYNPSYDVKDYRLSKDSAVQPEKKNTFDYRSLQITIQLGERRKELYECEDLTNIKCEIQARTILAHGWADVTHTLHYKPNLTIVQFKQIEEQIGVQLNAISAKLWETDMAFNDLRRKYELITGSEPI